MRLFFSPHHDLYELLLVLGYSTACASQRVSRSDDEGIANLPGELERLLQTVCDRALRHRLANLVHRPFEQVLSSALLIA